MDKQNAMVSALTELATALDKGRGNTPLTQLVHETLAAVTNGGGVGLTGAFQQFLNRAPVALTAEATPLDAAEQSAWDKVMSVKQLGNNLWGA